jgi:hypothetical protein
MGKRAAKTKICPRGRYKRVVGPVVNAAVNDSMHSAIKLSNPIEQRLFCQAKFAINPLRF